MIYFNAKKYIKAQHKGKKNKSAWCKASFHVLPVINGFIEDTGYICHRLWTSTRKPRPLTDKEKEALL